VLLGMLFVAPMHLVPTAVRYGEMGVIGLTAIVTVALRGIRSWQWTVPTLLAGYLLVVAYSTGVANIDGAWFQYYTHGLIGVAFLIFGMTANGAERLTIIRSVVWLGAAEAAYALAEYVVQPPVLWASPVPTDFEWSGSRFQNLIITSGTRSQGSFGHPLLLAMVLMVALGFALRLQFRYQWIKPALIVLFFAGNVASGSRSALVVMLAMLVLSLGTSKRIPLRAAAVGILAVAFVSLGDVAQIGVVQEFLSGGSLQHRQGAIDSLPRLLGQSQGLLLAGHGWFSTTAVYQAGLLQLDGFQAIDNEFIALLVSAGLIGLFLFFTLMVVAFVGVGWHSRLALVACYATFLVFDVLEFPATWSLLALLLGFAGSATRLAPGRDAIQWLRRPEPVRVRSAERVPEPVR
jgi:hypothetical protein